jgi:hypothetical protein
MRDVICQNLSGAIDPAIVAQLVETYERVISKFRTGDLDGCLVTAGKFVEHTLRAIEFIRAGAAPREIRSPAETIKQIEKDQNLPEPIRILIPRIAYSMIYEVRSKRGAVHVKDLDPRQIDGSLAVHAASWVIAELLRLYHSSSEDGVAEAMAVLMRGHLPFVEVFGDEQVVTKDVPCKVEILLLLSRAVPSGLDRKALGKSTKFPPPTVTRAIQRMEADRHIHKTRNGTFHITGPGEHFLSGSLVGLSSARSQCELDAQQGQPVTSQIARCLNYRRKSPHSAAQWPGNMTAVNSSPEPHLAPGSLESRLGSQAVQLPIQYVCSYRRKD